MDTVGTVLLVLIGLVELAVLGGMVRIVREQRRVAGRIEHLSDALALLTEAAETGFRANAVEISRMASRAGVRSASTQAVAARIARAREKGRSIADIAASEQLSEGEVGLHLHLAGQRPVSDSGKREPRAPKVAGRARRSA